MSNQSIQVFKFGGASLQNMEHIRKVINIIRKHSSHHESLLIVLSAAGKSTNYFEEILHLWIKHDKNVLQRFDTLIAAYYLNILHAYREEIKPDNRFKQFYREASLLLQNPAPDDEALAYDMLVSYGELLTSSLIHQILRLEGFNMLWQDARKILKTDRHHRAGKVNWDISKQNVDHYLAKKLSQSMVITQGFIASDDLDQNITLGREGSDYSAALFAAMLNAESVTVWKDVPGLMTADPHLYHNAVLIDTVSYRDAIEMTYYGAKIIHPKTLKPLENKQIPLFVKAFDSPDSEGTKICKLADLDKKIPPVCVSKQDQVLIRLSTLDLSFVSEEHLGIIYTHFARHRIKLNMARVTAISFDACFDYVAALFDSIVSGLSKYFKIEEIHHLDLLTFIEYDLPTIEKIRTNKEVVLEEKNERVAHILIKH